MPNSPAQTDRNRRRCIICDGEYFAFPSSSLMTCPSKICKTTHKSRYMSKHGDSKNRLHNIWCGMKTRCLTHSRYKHLSVCDEWQQYEAFRDWSIMNGYSETLEIDRRDNTKGYNPENCRWATRKQQMQNTGVRTQRNKTSQFKGVQYLSHTEKHWRALACVNGKPVQIGLYATETEAAKAYDEWAKQQYGSFANLNFKGV